MKRIAIKHFPRLFIKLNHGDENNKTVLLRFEKAFKYAKKF